MTNRDGLSSAATDPSSSARQTQLYHLLFASALDPILLVAANAIIVDCNHSAVLQLGAAAQADVIGRRIADISPQHQPDGQPSAIGAELLLAKARTHGSYRFEWVHCRLDGTEFLADVALTADPGLDGLIMVQWRDITARQQIEAALRRSEERYRLLAENARDVIWTLDLTGHFTYVSPSVTRLRGYTPEEVMHQSLAEAVCPASLPIVLAGLEETARRVRSGLTVEGTRSDIEQPCKDGSTVWTEVRTSGMYNAAGEFVGILGVTRDITERRRQEEQIRQLNATLEQRVAERTAELAAANAELVKAGRVKDQFLATISHELRTPLTGMLALTQAMQEELYGPLTLRQQSSLERIGDGGNQLLHLINQLIDLSRIEAAGLKLQLAPCHLDMICRNSLRAVQAHADHKQVALDYQSDQPDLVIEADAGRLKQIVQHLLDNAIKFTPPGGHVRLTTESNPATASLTLCVTDTGIGIDPGDLSRLFQPFTQLDSGLDRRYGGAGLGLVLVRRLAELHGGAVGVRSQPGAGSTFWVTLPWRPSPS